MATSVKSVIEELNQLPEHRNYGRVAGVLGLLVEVAGLERLLSIGARCTLAARDGRSVASEVIGFREGREWLEDNPGTEGLACSVVVVATSDEPPLVRRVDQPEKAAAIASTEQQGEVRAA